MIVYADTSFIVSLYLYDAHSDVALERVQRRPLFCLIPLHRAEFENTLALHLFRRKLSAAAAESARSNFERDRARGVWRDAAFPANTFDRSIDLARRYGNGVGFRTLDSLHIAAALELKAEAFWTFDDRQRTLAGVVGFHLG